MTKEERKKIKIWRITFIICLLVLIASVISSFTLVMGINNFTDSIAVQYSECGNYCEKNGYPLYLHDIKTRGCQCYTKAENPGLFKNFNSGLEFEPTRCENKALEGQEGDIYD